jgi:hypothetical protein
LITHNTTFNKQFCFVKTKNQNRKRVELFTEQEQTRDFKSEKNDFFAAYGLFSPSKISTTRKLISNKDLKREREREREISKKKKKN